MLMFIKTSFGDDGVTMDSNLLSSGVSWCSGCLERLKVLLKDDDSSVRTKATEVLYLLVTHSEGR